jgi:hypothetical protein
MIIRKIMAMNNPQMRSVKTRREEHSERDNAHEEACSSGDQPRKDGTDLRSSCPTSVDSNIESPVEVNGVSLMELFISLRGKQGERKRDTTTKFDSMYDRMDTKKALERMLTIPVDPMQLLLNGQDRTFDEGLPSSLSTVRDYFTREQAWIDGFTAQCADRRDDPRYYLQGQHSPLQFSGIFESYNARTWNRSVGPIVQVPEGDIMFFTILANTDVFSINFMDPKWQAFLPKVRSQAAAKQLSKSTMGVIRHNNGRGDHLKRDQVAGSTCRTCRSSSVLPDFMI